MQLDINDIDKISNNLSILKESWIVHKQTVDTILTKLFSNHKFDLYFSNNSDSENYEYFNDLKNILELCDSNISLLDNLICFKETYNNKSEKEKEKLLEYYSNSLLIAQESNYVSNLNVNNKLFAFNTFLIDLVNTEVEKDDKYQKEQESSILNIYNKINKNINKATFDKSNLCEDTLIISYKYQRVILPFKFQELDNILKNNKDRYKSYQEIILDRYTINMNRYKNAAASRFREAYDLIRNKCFGSLRDAVNVATELFLRTDLNPAIITACKTIDELDVYIALLDEDNLDNFRCFNIIYENAK